MNIAIIHLIAVGACGGTPGRNALRPSGMWAGYLKIRMFFLPGITAFQSVLDNDEGIKFKHLSVPHGPVRNRVP